MRRRQAPLEWLRDEEFFLAHRDRLRRWPGNLTGLSGLSGLSGVAGVASLVTRVLDQFTDVNATALTSHAIGPTNLPGTAWSLLKGTGLATIQSNAADLNPNGVNTGTYWVVDGGKSDGEVSADYTVATANQDGGLIFRAQDSTHFWLLDVTNGTTNTVTLYQDGLTIAAQNSVTINAGTAYSVRVTFSGSDIAWSVNGVPVGSFSSVLYQSSTRAGIAVGGRSTANHVTFDNFKLSA